jgi:hypothetical protein
MRFDIVLPSVLFTVSVASLLLYVRYERRIRILFGGQRLHAREAVIMVLAMGIMITIIAFIPQQAIMVLFLFSYSVILYLFAYLAASKWYLAILAPALFIVLYIYYWNMYLSNFFAIIFAISITLYFGSALTWKYITVFVPLLTLLDLVQVLGTGLMGQAAEKLIKLHLPAMISVTAFPSNIEVALGLGDVFLAGILAIQSTQKYGRKFGLLSIVAITAIFYLFWIIQINLQIRYLPATVPITSGWLIAMIAKQIKDKGLRKRL